MYEEYLDESQIANALGGFQPRLLRPLPSFPRPYAEALAGMLAAAQPAVASSKMTERVPYLRHLVDLFVTVDMAAALEEQRSEPYLDSLCYELFILKVPTFEHWLVEHADELRDEVI